MGERENEKILNDTKTKDSEPPAALEKLGVWRNAVASCLRVVVSSQRAVSA
jgi:hypothetical protein